MCVCVCVCLLPEARQQQLCLIVTKPPRPQLDRSHWYRTLLVGDRGRFDLAWVSRVYSGQGQGFEPKTALWWSDRWPGPQRAARVVLSWPRLALWTVDHQRFPLTEHWLNSNHIQLHVRVKPFSPFQCFQVWRCNQFSLLGSAGCSAAILLFSLSVLFLVFWVWSGWSFQFK